MRHLNTLALILTISVFLVFSAFVSADDEVIPETQNGSLFVDEDGDGVCDNKGTGYSRGHGQGKNYRNNFVDADGDGICDNLGTGFKQNRMHKFVDEDGDGVCDNCLNSQCNRNREANFVDEDGDGVCDNYAGCKKQGGGKTRGNR